MTLESSEVQNCSCGFSPILVYFLVYSSSCHDALSLFIRPMSRIHKNDSEDNLSFSRIQSLHHLLEVDYHDEEEYSIFLH